MRSRAPPSASSTVIVEPPKPLAASNAATAAGPFSSEVSAITRRPGCSSGRSSSTGLPCSDTVSISASGQPSRAAARLKAEGAGNVRHFCGWNQPRDGRADAVQERVARGQHADAAPAERHQVAHPGVERRRPLSRLPLDEVGRQVPDDAFRRTRIRPRQYGAWRRRPIRRGRPRRCRRWTATDGRGQVRGAI